ncbi:hypothetical protein BDN72DRAFT_864511 [Pluteus cervinus]|uniref:Uncharacterized protein n=1 Tax=Pluteus cervinus TaxID=181527 RepID=A0ACD3A3K9_9AGAR|nr:hypothetical protein BDN72DRAFT_864511 [Pluteus cervinus]
MPCFFAAMITVDPSAKANRGITTRSAPSTSISIASFASILFGLILMICYSQPTNLFPNHNQSLPATNFVYPDGVLLPKFTTVPAYRSPRDALLAYHVPFNAFSRIHRTNPVGFLAGDNQNPSWCFHGAAGTVAIALTRPVLPSHIVIQRQKTVFSGALPQSVAVWGLIDGNVNHEMLARLSPPTFVLEKDGHFFARLAMADYRVHLSPVLLVDERIVDAGIKFPVFMVEVQRNQGGAVTCIGTVEIRGGP